MQARLVRTRSRHVVILTASCLALGRSAPAAAQGITTAAIRGTVRAQSGDGVDGALVRVVNDATGYAIETKVRGDAFVVSGLETGGPYRVLVRSLGYSPQVAARAGTSTQNLESGYQLQVSLRYSF